MMQYIEEKKKLQDCIVFYRLGDFYEMFFDDALTASKELDLVLTGRNAGVEEKVPMCGIPFHAASGYIQRLTQKGYKVAIVEQLEDPAQTKGIVQRGCIKIVTPGTLMDESSNEKDSVYLAAFYDYQYGIAAVFCEMTTGECFAQLVDHNMNALQKLCLGRNVREVILMSDFDKRYVKMIEDFNMITVSVFNDKNLKNEYMPLMAKISQPAVNHAFALLTNYLDETQKQTMEHLTPVEMILEEETMQMDFSTRANLELTQPLRTNSKK